MHRSSAQAKYAVTDGAATLQRANSQARRAVHRGMPDTSSYSLGLFENLEFEEICGRLGQYDGRIACMSAQ
ncbi:MAG: hypothetical protein OXI87_15330 [Albidovulum sp.]|nr:hypothetical protein [Albidovulum sp.]